MGLTFPQYFSVCGCSCGSPYTSLVEVMRKRARVRLARPSMFIVPRKLVLMVLMGLYLGGAGRECVRVWLCRVCM